MSSASGNEFVFIGRDGSRKEQVDKLIDFLNDSHNQGFFQIFGCWKIGKTKIIEKAIAEIDQQRRPTIKKIPCSLPHPLTIETFKNAVENLINKKIYFRTNKSRFEDQNKMHTIVRKANSFIEEESKRYEIVLIWYQSTEIDYSEIDPSTLFLLPGVSRCGATRKVITEQRINSEVEWRKVKPPLYDEMLIKRFNESDVIDKDEVRALISQKLETKTDIDIAKFDNILMTIRRFCGQHPGLLECVCKILYDASIDFADQSIDSCFTRIKQLLDPRKKKVMKMLESLIKSLSDEAVENIKNDGTHLELEYNGLLTKDTKGKNHLILLLEMFFKNQNAPDNSSFVNNTTPEYQEPRDSIKKILILSSNPKDTPKTRIDEEVREIEESLRRSRCRVQFEIHKVMSVRHRDLRRALLDHKPQIVYFTGHWKKGSIVVEDKLGISESISSEAFSELIELCGEHVECVILSASYTEPEAEAISKHIDYVVGMRNEIEDSAIIEFAVGFYDALGAGKPVDEAFKFGCNAIKLYNLSEDLIPILKKKNTGKK
ncbi:MAG: hypothetical protein PVH61_13420 [Candidatus Aminicenantes bacterium]